MLLEGACITSNSREKVIGITIDFDLKFGKVISDLCNKICKNTNALYRVTGYMPLEKRRIVREMFVESKFNYWPLIWIYTPEL